ncbi:MAG: NAD(P)-binding domain-containing protein [Erysipelotrichaceae bacterium]|nr:NAD(P)-binding domain-containing protein [Erysipelotrichaceae bacterium]
MSRITVVGCGMMGGNLVDSFMKAGHEVTIVDINDTKPRPFIERGAHFYPTPEFGKALDTKFIVISLPTDDVFRSVLSVVDRSELKDKIFVNTSSEVLSDVIDCKNIIEGAGGHYIDTTIITYQGEVGTEYAYLVHSGKKEIFDYIKEDLRALSEPVYLGENITGAEIVDLVAIGVHFGMVFTPLEAIRCCRDYGIDVDHYLDEFRELMPILCKRSRKQAVEMGLENLDEKPQREALDIITKAMDDADINERFSEDWLNSDNRSVANHFRKMLGSYRSDYED